MPGRSSVVPTLELISKTQTGRMFELDADVISIGRDQHAHVCLEDGRVSTRHARILRRPDDSYVIEDTDSRNGTRLDGVLLEKFKPVLLKDGSSIRICDFTLVFHVQAVELREERPEELTILGTLEDMSSVKLASRNERAAVTLRAVLEINRLLGGATEVNEVLGRALEELFAIFRQAESGFILTREPDGKLSPRAIRQRDGSNKSLTLSQTVLNQVMREGKGLIISDSGDSDVIAIPDSMSRTGISTALCVPFLGRAGQPIGIIQLDSRDQKACFAPEDLELLAAVAVPIGVVVENNRLLKERAALTAATEVQAALLPRRRPSAPGYVFWEFYQPALEVGGDYYDYISVDTAGTDRWVRWAVSIGDVSGKGMPAALLMANLCAEVRHLVRAGASPHEVAEGVNHHFFDADLPCRFITLLVAMIDAVTHRITLVNAGHCCPLVRRGDGRIEEVGDCEAGMPLGIDRHGNYRSAESSIGPGDVFVMFTDGVSDAMGPGDTHFGIDGIKRTLATTPGGPALVGDGLLSALRSHASGRSQYDDIALICFGRT
jgi:pSer/pThr/pTyr-binding forkhead associated (FHA) protein